MKLKKLTYVGLYKKKGQNDLSSFNKSIFKFTYLMFSFTQIKRNQKVSERIDSE